MDENYSPYLIQRAEFKAPDNNKRKGIDAILRFDYMGSAEFEFGALPASLKRIRADMNQYTMFDYHFLKSDMMAPKQVTVFCKANQKKFVPIILEKLAKGSIHLKESCDLKDWVNPGLHPYQRNDFWWDIDKDFMFWKKNEIFDPLFQEKIKG